MLLVATGEAMVGKEEVMGTKSAKREWSTGYNGLGAAPSARRLTRFGGVDRCDEVVDVVDRRDR